MPALNLDTDADRIAERLRNPATLLVACLCAEWCGTCRDYRAAFNRLADAHPEFCFAWIDIETHADQLDDLDVENFPTLLIEDQYTVRFFGTVLPHATIVERMLADLSAVPGVPHAPKLRNLLDAPA
ncbi:thioredoxin family protein [Burkholderia alba]|uniref:thioredoxin family protein n=1 Tax=Burkholderia alba TaxID=2683677 RepID=UPI002B054D7F|nr:thioredoxin family protein [Burkholderia alba]